MNVMMTGDLISEIIVKFLRRIYSCLYNNNTTVVFLRYLHATSKEHSFSVPGEASKN